MEGMESSFPYLGVVGGNEMGRREHSFLSTILKPQIFIPSENRKEWEGMKLNLMNFFTKTLKIPLYIQPFILK